MKVAVLGLGSIGRRHAENLVRAGHQVVGFDPRVAAGEAVCPDGVEGAGSREAALGRCSAAVIASPNRHHLDDLRACVSAGCHAFVEKPLSHTDEGVDDLIQHAEREGLVVFPGLNLRFHPAVRAARRLLAEGVLGRLLWARLIAASYLPHWRAGSDHTKGYAADPSTGGVLFDIIHEFDLAVHLLGPASTVACAASCSGELGIAAEDCADVLLAHESGVRSSVHLDYLSRPALRQSEIQGTRGRLCIDIAKRSYSVTDCDGRKLAQEVFEDTFDDDYRSEMAEFISVIEEGSVPTCSAAEALSVLRLVISARALAGLPSV